MITIDSDRSAGLEGLLKQASQRLADDPVLAQMLHDGTRRLSCPVPPAYMPRMNRYADRLEARIDRGGRLFEISEVSDGISGGWMASCIPHVMYRIFLSAWLASSSARQLELFQ